MIVIVVENVFYKIVKHKQIFLEPTDSHHSKSKGRTESYAASIIKYATQDYVYLAYLKC